MCHQHAARPARGALHRRALRCAGAAARPRARGRGGPGRRAPGPARRAPGRRVRGAAGRRRAVAPDWPDNEDRPIAVDYTSGTTGRPKGVVYTHRGAYLGALADLVETAPRPDSRYLWTLPMFHCNGWCFSWAVAGAAPRSVVRAPDPNPPPCGASCARGATHLCAAPTVLIMLLAHPDAAPLEHDVTCVVGGAPPSPTLIERCEALGIRLVHMYGLTETYGPATVGAWPREWDALPRRASCRAARAPGRADRARRRDRRVGRRGRAGAARRRRPSGEVVIRGNTVMAGYLDDPGGDRRRRSAAAGSTRAMPPSCTTTAASSCATASRT